MGPTPVELVAQNYGAVFTNPQTTENQLAMLSANGSVKLSDTWTASGVAYLRNFHQSHVDGNLSSVAPCNVLTAQNATPPQTPSYDATSPLCLQTVDGSIVPVTDQHGKQVLTGIYGPGATIGEIDYTTNDTTSYGTALQATDKDKLFGLNNIFIAGASVDHGDVKSTSIAELGTLNTQTLTVAGNGIFLSGPLDISPVNLSTTTNYYGLFFTDTLDLTKSLSATVGGRYNYEELQLADPTGLLTGNHLYTRFNPMAGLTYKLNPTSRLTRAIRRRTARQLRPNWLVPIPHSPAFCKISSSAIRTSSRSCPRLGRADFAGNFSPFGYGRLDWTAGVFHTENFDDILNVTDPTIRTRGYFTNAGDSLRQGVEASLRYKWEHLTFNANYAYVDATFLSNLTIPSPNNPFADANGNIFVHPGDHIPTIPPHRLKASFDYDVNDEWKVGADVVLASSQYFFGG